MKARKLIVWSVVMLMAGCSPSGEKQAHEQDNAPLVAAEPIDSTQLQPIDAATMPTSHHQDTMNTTDTTRLTAMTQQGTFVEIQFGDYAHFILKDAEGQLHSYYLADELPYEAWADYELPKMAGTQVEVTYRTVDKFLEAAGAVNEIEEITALKRLD